jgi:hypothetical protein
MPKVRKPGWQYIYSDELKEEIALNEKTGWVFCEDGVRYSPKEIELMRSKNMAISRAAHLVKKQFGGEIVDGTVGRDCEGKQAEAGSGNDRDKNKDTAPAVSTHKAGVQGANAGDGDLDIF